MGEVETIVMYGFQVEQEVDSFGACYDDLHHDKSLEEILEPHGLTASSASEDNDHWVFCSVIGVKVSEGEYDVSVSPNEIGKAVLTYENNLIKNPELIKELANYLGVDDLDDFKNRIQRTGLTTLVRYYC